REPGYKSPRNNGAAQKEREEPDSDYDTVAFSPEFSEDALGLRFTGRHAEDLRYTASMGNWHRWTGQQWLEDGTLEVFDLARKICRNAASDCPNVGIARQIAKASTVAAVERLARADRQHAMTIDEWDSDLWLLNTPSGLVNL